MNKIIKRLTILTLTILSGCAVFPGGETPDITLETTTLKQIEKPTLSYEMSATGGLYGAPELSEKNKIRVRNELINELNASGYFKKVEKNLKDADIFLNVKLVTKNNQNAKIAATITGASLYIIPSWATEWVEIKAIAKNKQGLTKEYTFNDTSTIVQWLPMIFLSPIYSHSTFDKVRQNMYRALIAAMAEDGFITASDNSAASKMGPTTLQTTPHPPHQAAQF